MRNKITFDRALIEKCQTNAPRYTSYPTADRFGFQFNQKTQLEQISQITAKPISLYIHIPFCNTLCLYCGCNKIITNKRQDIDHYLDYLELEMKLYYQLINIKLDVVQLHFGGGSPSWMDENQVSRIMNVLRNYFNIENASEIAMEIDPRHCNAGYVANLKNNGFNRISLGIQDFDPIVQKAVNRIQTYEESNNILKAARHYGFSSTSVDLIYGLPFQSLSTFSKTIEQIIIMRPDRISLFNYAHIPGLLMPQTRIKETDLPTASVKLDILQMSVENLTDAGYVFIGMDHFAVPSDDLAIALNNNTLQRNFQGYSTFSDTDMFAFGVSSIGFINNSYYQNTKDINSYYASIENNQLPILRGIMLTHDDIIRKHIIQKIMCQFSLDFKQIENAYNINFSNYFATEITELANLEQLGLIHLATSSLEVTATGRFLIRNVAVVFDKYFRESLGYNRYSKVI